MWNKEFIEFLLDLSKQYPDILFVLEGRTDYGIPCCLSATNTDTDIFADISGAYRDFIRKTFPKVVAMPEEQRPFDDYIMCVGDRVVLDDETTFVRAGGIA